MEDKGNNPVGSGGSRRFGEVQASAHRRCLDADKLGQALAQIRDCGAWWAVKCCLLFLVLTCVRSREAREATWEEIDFETATWTIPATRMKTGIEHRVPLSSQALEVLAYARSQGGGAPGVIFPTPRSGSYMDAGRLSRLMQMLVIPGVPHGFRSSFMNWAVERPHITAAAAASVLAHTPSNTVVASFMARDLFEQRRPIMQEWGDIVTETIGPVVPAIPSSQ